MRLSVPVYPHLPRPVRPPGRVSDAPRPVSVKRRVFWIADNGSADRGLRSIRRLRETYPNLLLVHGPCMGFSPACRSHPSDEVVSFPLGLAADGVRNSP